jgi:L-asparaginase II
MTKSGNAYAGGVLVTDVVRSGVTESRHHGSVVVLGPSGQVVASVGDTVSPVFPRSSNKPVQAVAMLRSGLVLADPADLALVAASHSAEPFHVDRVRAMLRRGGLTEDDLGCPPDLPLGEAARVAVLRAGGAPARIYMNCSGKHAGMLLTCAAAGWPTAGYLDPAHPLQQACRATLEAESGESVAAVGLDGCGAPVLAISLAGLARAFLGAVHGEPGSAVRRVADAMRAHPELVSGTGREDALLMGAVPGLLSKVGAEGVWAVAAPGLGAVALKIDDGAMRATRPVLVAALDELGRRSGLDPFAGSAADVLVEFANTPILGGGVRVGSIRASEHLLAALREGRATSGDQAHASGS